MFKIIKDGEQIGITEKLHYIYQKENGVFYECDSKEAQGIAWKGTPYNLRGRAPMAVNETVIVIEVDGGEHIHDGENNQYESDALIVDHEYRLTLIELGVS
jgi:hypothetical protein